MSFVLVLQFEAIDLDDYDWLISIEQRIEEILHGKAEVDGHDSGSDEMNLFIMTDSPRETFDTLLRQLPELKLKQGFKAAFRDTRGSGEYFALWPSAETRFSIR